MKLLPARWLGSFLLVLALALGTAMHSGAQPPEVSDVPAQRIISMAPSITEILFALGAGGQLVGTSDFTTWPPEAASVPRVGGWSNPNYEVISGLRPDLILIQGQHQKVRAYAEERGLRLDGVTMEGFASIRDGIVHLGELLQRTSQSLQLLARIDAELDTIAADLPSSTSWPTVFICIGRQPGSLNDLTTANAGSFLDDTVGAAGGHNLFGDLKQPYPQVSKEALIARKPDVIFEIRSEDELEQSRADSLIADWRALPMLPAVRNQRVYVLHGDYMLIPGPRLIRAVHAAHAALWPGHPNPE